MFHGADELKQCAFGVARMSPTDEREEDSADQVGGGGAEEQRRQPAGRGLRLGERDLLGTEDEITVAGHLHLVLGNDEAVAFAAAPLAGGIAIAAAEDPDVVGGRVRGDNHQSSKEQRKTSEASEHE